MFSAAHGSWYVRSAIPDVGMDWPEMKLISGSSTLLEIELDLKKREVIKVTA